MQLLGELHAPKMPVFVNDFLSGFVMAFATSSPIALYISIKPRRHYTFKRFPEVLVNSLNISSWASYKVPLVGGRRTYTCL